MAMEGVEKDRKRGGRGPNEKIQAEEGNHRIVQSRLYTINLVHDD